MLRVQRVRKLKKKQERERERDEGAKKRVRAQVIVSLLGPCMPTPQAAILQTVQRSFWPRERGRSCSSGRGDAAAKQGNG